MDVVQPPRGVWLSSSEYATSEDGQRFREQIRDIFGHLFSYSDLDECEDFIRKEHHPQHHRRIFLIVHEDFFLSLVERKIHHLRLIETIFIYSEQECQSFLSSRKYDKIEGFYYKTTDLLVALSKSVDRFSTEYGVLISRLKQSDPELTINIVNNFADYSEFWYPLFLDLIFDLPCLDDEHRTRQIDEFLNQCRRFFAHNPAILTAVDTFLTSNDDGYTSQNAVSFYTKDNFLHKRVNKALRQQNFQAILDIRFFLHDMDVSLREAYKQFEYACYQPGDLLTFYRGQSMTNEEIKLLQEKRRHGSLLTVNSYLSTTMRLDVALKFARSHPNRELSPVLFDIKAEYRDPTIFRRKPFASISHLSHFGSEECEVLFSMGSFFRVDNFKFDTSEQINRFQLTFIYDEDCLTITDDFNALRQGSCEDKLLKIGRLLSIQSQQKSIKAQAFYQRFLDEQYSSLIDAACYAGLGWLAFEQHDRKSTIMYQEKALDCYNKEIDVPDFLRVTSYNCLGATYARDKEYSKALVTYLDAYKISPTAIPIDKYAFYNQFLNSSSVNIACLYKIRGCIDKAWSTYQKLLAMELRHSDQFHAAIYLKIAEAGLIMHRPGQTSDQEIESIENWKRFLDLSLAEMSSSYRRSIVSGVLSIGFRFAHAERTRDIAIDYYKAIIRISQRFMDCSLSDYKIVLQCYLTIAQLYQEKANFTMSTSYAIDALKQCWRYDVSSILECYLILIQTYEKQLEVTNTNLSPVNIDVKLALDGSETLPVTTESSTSPKIVLDFQHDEFSFGEYRKMLNPNLIHEYDYKRCLAHCLLKVATLKYELDQYGDLEEYLGRVRCLLPNTPEITSICNNNLAYLSGDFDQIINIYKETLDRMLLMRKDDSKCIDEVGYSYIGHLMEKKGDLNGSERWYAKAIDYFFEYRYFCSHTRVCFDRMALFYQRRKNMIAAVNTYRSYIHYLRDYSQGMTDFQRSIIVLVEEMMIQSNSDLDHQIHILKILITLTSESSTLVMNEHILSIVQFIQKNHSDHGSIVQTFYESYLTTISNHYPSLINSNISTLINISRTVIDTYASVEDFNSIFELYSRLIIVILKYSTDWEKITHLIKRMALELEVKDNFLMAFEIYQTLYQFIQKHPAGSLFQNTNLMVYILERCQLLVGHDQRLTVIVYRKMIEILELYWQMSPSRSICNINFIMEKFNHFLLTLGANDQPLAMTYYDRILDLLFHHQPEKFDVCLQTIVKRLQYSPTECLQLLTKYYFNYIQLIRWICKYMSKESDQLDNPPSTQSSHLNMIVSSYLKKAKRTGQTERCFSECLYYLLEQCSKQDSYFAECYVQLDDQVQAANVFDPSIYRSIALNYCPNACRRYLTYVYPQQSSNEELLRQFSDHFHFIDGKREIRPLEPTRML